MTAENPVILHIGNPIRELTVAPSWYIYHGGSCQSALGMYVFYQPDIVLIETTPDLSLAEATYTHLNSIEASPLLILGARPADWDAPHGDTIVTLPADISNADLLNLIAELCNPQFDWQP